MSELPKNCAIQVAHLVAQHHDLLRQRMFSELSCTAKCTVKHGIYMQHTTQRRAWGSNPEPVSRHHISSVITLQQACKIDAILRSYTERGT